MTLFCFVFYAVQSLTLTVQKSDYLFRGGVKVSPRTALLLSKPHWQCLHEKVEEMGREELRHEGVIHRLWIPIFVAKL